MRKRYLIGISGIVAVAALAWAASHRPSEVKAAAPETPPVPVVAASVVPQDFPIVLSGLGTVQAFNTVTIHSRVDGQIQSIAFTEGQKVKTGDTLLQIDPRPFQAQLDQAVAAKARDEAQLANTQLNLKRDTALVKPGYATVQAFDTDKALVQQLQATVQNDQAQIDYAKVQLGYTTITSPIDGVTGIRLIDVGNIVHAADTTGIVVLTQVEPITVIFPLPEKSIPDIRQHLAAGPLTVQALSEDGRTRLGEGRLELIDNQVDPQSGTVRLKAVFPNKDDRLWPGQFVNARLVLDTRHDAVAIPNAAIQRGPKGTFAYVVKPDRTAELRPIETATSDDGRTLVLSGLSAGDQVVVDGQSRLQPGAHVAVQTAQAATASQGETP